MNLDSIATAQLWIGNQSELGQRAVRYLQRLWCSAACGKCISCNTLSHKQHQRLLWIEPEKNYTLETVAPIFDTICFLRSADDPFFFVLTDVDTLSTVCANSLLKSIEEPPAGYHFILLAQRKEMVLPTIRSRCHITEYQAATNNVPESFLVAHFTKGPTLEAAIFLQQLERSAISELESITIFEGILAYWIDAYKAAVRTNHTQKIVQAEKKVSLLKKMMEQFPMPGSSKIFWKTLYLLLRNIEF